MPFRHLPTSVGQRLAALHCATTKWNSTAAPDRLITAAHFAALDLANPASLHSVYRRDIGESSAALAQQASRTREHDQAIGALGQVVSHFIQVFNFAVSRGLFQRNDRAYYGLDINRADVPPLQSHAEIDRLAHQLIGGETFRLSAQPGATAMAMPAVGEISAALAAVEAALESQTTAKDTYDKELGDVETTRTPVDALIIDMWETIEFNLRSLDSPSKRRRAREWGVVYLTRPGEPPDPEGDTPPPPTP
jgi:hypothetical protein